MLLRREARNCAWPRNGGARHCRSRPCRPAPRRAAGWEFRASALSSSLRGLLLLRFQRRNRRPSARATSAISVCAVASSLLFFAAPISFEAALRRACAASAFWIAARRRSSIAISRCASPVKPAPRQRAVEGVGVVANPFDVVHGEFRVMPDCAGIHASYADRTGWPGTSPAMTSWRSSSARSLRRLVRRMPAGCAAALRAFFSTSRTDQIEPS